MKRGAVVVVRATNSPASKSRPCIVVQHDATLEIDPPKVTVCPLSSVLRGPEGGRPLLTPSDANGLRVPSEVEIDWLYTFPIERIGSVIGQIGNAGMLRIDEALRRWLSL